MSKVAGSYESVVGGVSEQVPQDRRSGQHFEQVNMVSDPVRGLARRAPSVLQDELILSAIGPLNYPGLVVDTEQHRVTPFSVGAEDFDLIHRCGSDVAALGRDALAWVYNKTARHFVPLATKPIDPTVSALASGGVSAVVSVGRFVFVAGNTITPSYTSSSPWSEAANQRKLAVWVRGGAYSRNFSITLSRADGTKVEVSYKTVSSSYPGELDTTDILASDPEYQKKTNDRTNAYNSQVTQWIGTAAEDITPENIAEKLRLALVGAGVSAARVNSTVVIDVTGFVEADADDAGDGTLIRAVGNKVSNVDLVSTVHWAGKVVKVQPKDADSAVYLKAVPKHAADTGWCDVTWQETAGHIMQPQTAFAIGTVEGGTFYLGGTPAILEEISGVDVPSFAANGVGDDLSCPLPELFGKTISYLGLFQDRLVVGSGATLLFSRPGDYFNWFRKSVLTVADDDPWEGLALGAEADTILHSTLYDRNLLLYGKRFQYVVSGRQPLTPNTASVVLVSAHEDATLAPPQASGNFVFYATASGEDGAKITTLQQLRPGIIADNPESSSASQQLDQYLSGSPTEIVALRTPNMVVLRTDRLRNRVYTYSYLDSADGGERLFDSWSRWEWDARMGNLVGLSKHDGAILAYMVRIGDQPDGERAVWLACERFVRDSALSAFPYLDSLRPVAAVLEPAEDAWLHETGEAADGAWLAVGNSGPKRFLGEPLDNAAEFMDAYGAQPSLWAGLHYDAYVTPTNPFMRDRNGKAILTGRLTLGRVNISVADTGGMTVTVTSSSGTGTSLDFSGRVLGAPGSVIGTQPIASTNLSAIIGKEVRDCRYTISSKRWLPLTITSIEWVGQFFNNVRRA